MMEIWEYIKELFPQNGVLPINEWISTLLYLAIALFLSACLLDLILKAVKRLFRREHQEHKIKRKAKKFLKASIIAKFSYIAFSLILIFFKALSISEWLRHWITTPESVLILVRGNWLLWFILCVLLLFRLRKRHSEF